MFPLCFKLEILYLFYASEPPKKWLHIVFNILTETHY